MCEADIQQLTSAAFTETVEAMYGPIAVIANACGKKAHKQTYPCGAQVVALSPYYRDGRDEATDCSPRT